MTILVTGGAGFVGSHLCDALMKNGDRVIALDNFFTGQESNISHLKGNPQFKIINHDLVEPFFSDEQIDQVYNLACPASPVHYQYNPIKTIKTSTVGVVNILGLAKKHGARILQTSTSEIYGDPEIHPQPESYWGNVNPIGPRACYDEGKRVAETLFFDYHRSNNVDIRVVRLFNTYGPRMHPDDGRVVSNFIIQALANKPITIHGDGSQTRSFCYVSDLVEGLQNMMNQTNTTGPINLGNPQEISMKALAEKIISFTDSKSTLTFLPSREDDPKQRQPDITQAKEKLNWEPSTDLTNGLKKTIDYFKSIAIPA